MKITGRSILVFLFSVVSTYSAGFSNFLNDLPPCFTLGTFFSSVYPSYFLLAGAPRALPVSRYASNYLIPLESLSRAPSTSSIITQTGFFYLRIV
jgi:hypothetical protein